MMKQGRVAGARWRRAGARGGQHRLSSVALVLLSLAGLSLAGLTGCRERSQERVSVSRASLGGEKQAFVPLPPRAAVKLDPARVALGRRLFDDPSLSGDRTVACSSCHLHEQALTNAERVAALATRPAGALNVPSLYNVTYSFRYNWDGRFLSLEAQLDALIEKPAVMASSWAKAASQLREQPGYVSLFSASFADGLTPLNVRTALIDYMTSLTTPGSRFDRWLEGDERALDERERRGYRLFNSFGCSSCHQGRNIGGNMLQQFGIIEEGIIDDYFKSRGRAAGPTDRGYGNVTGQREDDYYFRVPSLRNVALTAPYFHDGGAPTLDEAVRVMGRVQLGREFEASEVEALVAFLSTLTGEVDDGGPR